MEEKEKVREVIKVDLCIPDGVDKSSFLWKFIEGELLKQSIRNLINLRKKINHILQVKFREEEKEKERTRVLSGEVVKNV
jgi:hypothetical protein